MPQWGKNPADRVKALLGKLDSRRSSQERGASVSSKSKVLFHKFVEHLGKVFKNLPKPLEWRSFYNNDLPLLMDIYEEVRKISIQKALNRSQTRAPETLKEASSEEFQRVTFILEMVIFTMSALGIPAERIAGRGRSRPG